MSTSNRYADLAELELHPASSTVSAEERARLCKAAGFGRVFTDNMVVIPYDANDGWGKGRLEPFGPLSLHPASAVLHYAQAIFEGFKAYAQPDGSVATFRPEANAARFQLSAERLAMPVMPVERFVAAADALVLQDHAWAKGEGDHSLYVRPHMFATDPFLGVRPSQEYLFQVIAFPATSYFSTGDAPVSVWISTDYTRAVPGGTGAAKCAGNYAASLVAQKQAQERGCQQVVWLDAKERRYVEEMGGMNIFFVLRDGDRVTLATPELSGTILPGITRDSLMTLARDMGHSVEERTFSVEEWKQAAEAGHMSEVFACGTAAIVTSIGRVESATGGWNIGDGTSGPIAQQLRKALLDIQYGRAPDRYGWMHPVT
ncbi:branched-chain amino acid aminotransferase [Haliangium sp.]|uniref:branched-chain amino acid aminotransferase n=1 Tax=Haliangium sp. TaxID=2663208 RepID=UPI003D117D34